MADNKIYIAAGIIPNDTGEVESSNQFFMASGLIPTDKSAPPTGNPFWYYNMIKRRN